MEKKQKQEQEVVSVKIPKSLKEKIRVIALERGETLNGTINIMLNDWFVNQSEKTIASVFEDIETRLEKIEQAQHKLGGLMVRNKKAIETDIALNTEMAKEVLIQVITAGMGKEDKVRWRQDISNFVAGALSLAREEAIKKIEA